MKPKIVIGVLIIVVALGYLIIGGFKENAVYYLTIPEVHAKTSLQAGEGLRVSGYVVPQSIDWNADKIDLHFAMTESGDTLNVYYKGIMPDQLAEAQQVVAEGHLDSSGVLVASKLLLKCPSKYEVKNQGNYNRGY
jgi:cytochrome c-type biogenesis protein CcmE